MTEAGQNQLHDLIVANVREEPRKMTRGRTVDALLLPGESFEDWAYAMFGLDCCPAVEQRHGEPCLGITDSRNHRRYAIPLRMLRAGRVGDVTADAIH